MPRTPTPTPTPTLYDIILFLFIIPFALIFFSFVNLKKAHRESYRFRNVRNVSGEKDDVILSDKKYKELEDAIWEIKATSRWHGKKIFGPTDTAPSYFLFWDLFYSAIMIVAALLIILIFHASGKLNSYPFFVEFYVEFYLVLIIILGFWLKYFLPILNIYCNIIGYINHRRDS